MAHKYTNPSGFPENLPEEQIVEEKMKASIRREAELFGYVPLETSAVEYLATIMSKGEINKEIYTISRALGGGPDETLESERALRFDLTVPFARYVGQHYENLVFPFKRYQIQRVWRGERPQKGRFREFYQADIDIVANGTLPLHCDAEVASVALKILESFNFGNFTIHINNRKFLQGIIESFSISDTASAMRIIDKLDKVGKEATQNSLVAELGITKETAFELLEILNEKIAIRDIKKLEQKYKAIAPNENLTAGFEELKQTAESLIHTKTSSGKFVINLSIVRGLDYYTGTILETTIDGHEDYGSICSGGRYANLAGKFITRELPGVGVGIGFTRIFDFMKNQKLLHADKKSVTSVIVGLKNNDDRIHAETLAIKLREHGINTEVFYKDDESLGKQAQFAEKRGARFLVTISDTANRLTVNSLDGKTAEFPSVDKLLEAIR